MDRVDALRQLLVNVEAGSAGDWLMYIRAFGLRPDDVHVQAFSAYNGSLDAAKALHEAVLSYGVIWDYSHSYFGYEFSILHGEFLFDGCSKHNPARAWLMAILEALIAQEEASK